MLGSQGGCGLWCFPNKESQRENMICSALETRDHLHLVKQRFMFTAWTAVLQGVGTAMPNFILAVLQPEPGLYMPTTLRLLTEGTFWNPENPTANLNHGRDCRCRPAEHEKIGWCCDKAGLTGTAGGVNMCEHCGQGSTWQIDDAHNKVKSGSPESKEPRMQVGSQKIWIWGMHLLSCSQNGRARGDPPRTAQRFFQHECYTTKYVLNRYIHLYTEWLLLFQYVWYT